MFLVFRKDKIYAYLVSILTVILLFFIANVTNAEKNKTVVTSANTENYIQYTK